MTDILIRNGTVIDPSQGIEGPRDILVRDGRIAELAPRIETGDADIFDAAGLVVAPGFIDLHVHLREPGFEYKETIETGARAAVAGGFTSICCMPNTQPVNDNSSVTSFIVAQGKAAGLANVFPIGAITLGSKGEHLAEMGEMKSAGIVAVSDDGKPVLDSGIMRRAMEYASDFDLPVVDHCEDCCGASGWAMHEGEYSALMGLKGLPGAAEDLHVARDLILAEMTGAHIHIAHLSTARSVELVREAKRRGVRVTCEVTPHHFTLTDRDLFESGYDTSYKMAPPLRSAADLAAVIEGIRDGTIDAIATDHAPHTQEAKEQAFDQAPPGMLGLETALALALTELDLPSAQVLALLSWRPAAIAGLSDQHGGPVAEGRPANLCVIDPGETWTVDPARSASRSRNNPYAGRTLTGRVRHTFLFGEPVVIDGEAQR